MSISEQAIERNMQKYGISREAAIAIIQKQLESMPGRVNSDVETKGGGWYDRNVTGRWYESEADDPTSPVVEEKIVKKDENGRIIETTIKNPNNAPDALAKKALKEAQDADASEVFDDYMDPIQNMAASIEPEPVERTPMQFSNVVAAPSVFDEPEGLAPMKFAEAPEINNASDAIEVLVEDDDLGHINTVNAYAKYAQKVSEEEALLAADNIMTGARESGLDKAKPRIYKALGIALTSMLFGADATEGFNTGLEVVGQDYAAEAAARAATASALADQNKFMFEETFKTNEDIRKEQEKNKGEAGSKRRTVNNTVAKEIVSWAQGLDNDLKEGLGLSSLSSQVHGAINEMNKVYQNKFDLGDSGIRTHFEKAVSNWMEHRKHTGDRSESIASFVKDQIARSELTKYEGTIDEEWLLNKGKDDKAHREDIGILFSEVQKAANIVGMEKAAQLYVKDFKDYADVHPSKASADAAEAAKIGMDPFVYFVRNYPANAKLGMAFKDNLK